MLRRYGQPVAYFRALNLNDLNGVGAIAKRCPACYDDAYAQSRADCVVCYNTTLVSIEDSPDQFIDADGYLTLTVTAIPAPLYGGYLPPVITTVIQSDVSEDVLRFNEQGVLIKTQDEVTVAYWTPTMGDNDMMVNVVLDPNLRTVIEHSQRFLLKMVQPATIRGWGKRKADQSYIVQQQFNMNTLPLENILYSIPLPSEFEV